MNNFKNIDTALLIDLLSEKTSEFATEREKLPAEERQARKSELRQLLEELSLRKASSDSTARLKSFSNTFES